MKCISCCVLYITNTNQELRRASLEGKGKAVGDRDLNSAQGLIGGLKELRGLNIPLLQQETIRQSLRERGHRNGLSSGRFCP